MKSFTRWDIYYLNQYAYSFMLHGDGEPLLLAYEDEHARFCYVVMQQDIAEDQGFQGRLEYKKYYDFETPYGYGGPLSDGEIPEHSQECFLSELSAYCRERGIVSQFIRFHPLLGNHTLLKNGIEIRYLRDTIYMDTTTEEGIIQNMDSKNRNMVRKAIKNGVTIERREISDYHAFTSMYAETMKKNGATEYYTFQENYFASLKMLEDYACIFYAMLEGVPISGAIVFYNERFLHYHLSGTHTNYRKYSPGNLLLYEAACWAKDRGIKRFHLGGGMSMEDSLFGFKKQFNKKGRIPFVVGRTIFDKETYRYLCRLRKEIDQEFNENNTFMIQYRR